jgi:SAM-dependent methyltransferase
VSDKRLALSFGRVAELYDRVRPDYSQASLDRAQAALELDAAAVVIDLAAGTGRLTHELAKRFASVIAVEPDDAMRSLIADGQAVAGTAEEIPLPDASADAVFVGEAFHWFEAPAAVSEIARVLRPRGGLALISNLWWETDPPLPERVLELLRAPFVRSGRAETVETWPDAFRGSGVRAAARRDVRHRRGRRRGQVARDVLDDQLARCASAGRAGGAHGPREAASLRDVPAADHRRAHLDAAEMSR